MWLICTNNFIFHMSTSNEDLMQQFCYCGYISIYSTNAFLGSWNNSGWSQHSECYRLIQEQRLNKVTIAADESRALPYFTPIGNQLWQSLLTCMKYRVLNFCPVLPHPHHVAIGYCHSCRWMSAALHWNECDCVALTLHIAGGVNVALGISC